MRRWEKEGRCERDCPYDEDYDRIAEITGQPAEWIAPRGSL